MLVLTLKMNTNHMSPHPLIHVSKEPEYLGKISSSPLESSGIIFLPCISRDRHKHHLPRVSKDPAHHLQPCTDSIDKTDVVRIDPDRLGRKVDGMRHEKKRDTCATLSERNCETTLRRSSVPFSPM